MSVSTEPVIVTGTVVHGDGRGRGLGFPTANLHCGAGVDADDGIYAAWVLLAGPGRWPATVSIGVNPTFRGERERRLEVHLHDLDVDLYGRRLRVELVAYLRPTLCFPDADALIDQSVADVRCSRLLLEARSSA